jgi:hypothetical protein
LNDEEYEDEEDEEEEEQERSIVKEITDYEEGKTTYLYDNGTYEVVYHETEEASECLVATACYGSALDEQVLFLRRFRDIEVMGTIIGRNFMRLFNTIYYYFSPTLASFIAHHRRARLAVRYAAVGPMIHLLRLSCYLTGPLSKVSALGHRIPLVFDSRISLG